MGWGYCGKNSTTGEEMGYSVEGICHEKGCNKQIDHGLAYVCGGMHEASEGVGCGYYFCTEHLYIVSALYPHGEYEFTPLCEKCVSEQDDSRI